MFDYLIVGCGLSGATCARLLAEKRKKVLIIDKRNHIAGNVYDEYNEDGIFIHRYGPHIFHTSYQEVWAFLSRFTRWQEYQHRVKAFVRGMLVPMPLNLDTINLLYGTQYTVHNLEQEFYAKLRQADMDITNARDMVMSKIGQELYDLFFKNYTLKQWGIPAEELDKEVTARIPVRCNRDDRYFTDIYQGMPKEGYTHLVSNLLDHKGIHVMLQTDYKDVAEEIGYEQLIYTGQIDEFFSYRYGKLPYRSLKFVFETFPVEQYQAAAVINYPNDGDYTRVTEFKYLTGQRADHTIIVREYPVDEGLPYYPIPRPANRQLYQRYADDAAKLANIQFLGRLGLYQYANMDAVVKSAIDLVRLKF